MKEGTGESPGPPSSLHYWDRLGVYSLRTGLVCECVFVVGHQLLPSAALSLFVLSSIRPAAYNHLTRVERDDGDGDGVGGVCVCVRGSWGWGGRAGFESNRHCICA